MYSGVLICPFIFLPENTKCMYFCVIRQESEWTNKNSTVINFVHQLYSYFFHKQSFNLRYLDLPSINKIPHCSASIYFLTHWLVKKFTRLQEGNRATGINPRCPQFCSRSREQKNYESFTCVQNSEF